MLSSLTLLSLLAVLVAPVQADQYCYDRFGRVYRCNGGLSYGARIGIGIGIAAAVLLIFGLCGYWRRRQIKNQFSKYSPPALPYHHNTNNNSTNPYANNPPPPNNGGGGGQTNWSNNPYGNNPPPPAQTYQPSSAGQYGYRNGDKVNGSTPAAAQNEHEHGYEWEQAREAERLERENGGNAPPGYDVAASQNNTGNSTHGYAPPPGAPPNSKETPIVRNL